MRTTFINGRTRWLAFAAAALAVVSLTTLGTSLALFTSQATVANNAFTTGTVIITTDHPATAIVNYSNMAPGDQVTNPLLVSNAGSLGLRYAVSSSATNADSKGLKDQLVLTIKSGVTACTNGGFGASGVVQYAGDLDFSTGKLIGDVATGQDGTVGAAGADRVLAAAISETLCWNVSLPIGTGNAFQNATTTATFTFDAEQTVNN